MGNNYDIILIGLVAIFLILRLRAVLGKRTGNERPPARDPFSPPTPPPPPAGPPRIGDAPSGNDNVIPLPNSNAPSQRPPLAVNAPGGIRSTVLPAAGRVSRRSAPSIRASSRSASRPAHARAFTTIVEAFAKSDIGPLQALLDPQTFASFKAAIAGRIERREKAETTLIGFEASDIAMAEMQGSFAQVTVRFVSEQINVLRNADGQIADGNPNEVQKVVDLWTFRRDTKSSDPNWLLIKTESEG